MAGWVPPGRAAALAVRAGALQLGPKRSRWALVLAAEALALAVVLWPPFTTLSAFDVAPVGAGDGRPQVGAHSKAGFGGTAASPRRRHKGRAAWSRRRTH